MRKFREKKRNSKHLPRDTLLIDFQILSTVQMENNHKNSETKNTK